MNKKNDIQYIEHYLKINHTYPSVFALKMFLGKNPLLNMKEVIFKNKTILDIGFGDGRDLNLFLDLQFNVYGIEPSPDVVKHTIKKFLNMENKPQLSAGTNINTNLKDNFFDFIYASGSIYYMPDQNKTITDAFSESYRICKKQGYFLGTLAKNNTHAVLNAEEIKPNLYILKDEFYNQRRGQVYHTYESSIEVKNDLLKSGFSNPIVCDYQVDWFGTKETLFMFLCQKVS